MKKNKAIRTTFTTIAAEGFVLSRDQLAAAVGGMRCGEGWTEVSTATLNTNGGSDTQTDCTK